jgi:hypothetical protein
MLTIALGLSWWLVSALGVHPKLPGNPSWDLVRSLARMGAR